MAKEITGYVKLQIKGGQANPAPPVGPALGQRGINIMEFCKAFNEKTKALVAGATATVSTAALGVEKTISLELKLLIIFFERGKVRPLYSILVSLQVCFHSGKEFIVGYEIIK